MTLIDTLMEIRENKKHPRRATGKYEGFNVTVNLYYNQGGWFVGAWLDDNYKCKFHHSKYWAEKYFNNLIKKYNLIEDNSLRPKMNKEKEE